MPSRKQELQAIVRYSEYLRIERMEGFKQGSLHQRQRNLNEGFVIIAFDQESETVDTPRALRQAEKQNRHPGRVPQIMIKRRFFNAN